MSSLDSKLSLITLFELWLLSQDHYCIEASYERSN